MGEEKKGIIVSNKNGAWKLTDEGIEPLRNNLKPSDFPEVSAEEDNNVFGKVEDLVKVVYKLMHLSEAVDNLLLQIKISDFRDEYGHPLKMNNRYHELLKAAKDLGGN